VIASEIEVRYAIQPMGRDRELVRLLDLDLMELIEFMSQRLKPEPIRFDHQLLRFGGEYVLRIKIQKLCGVEVFDVYLNASEVAFMVRFEGKNHTVITSKSVCQVIAQLSLGMKPEAPPSSGHVQSIVSTLKGVTPL
jgi:hypothetical protein